MWGWKTITGTIMIAAGKTLDALEVVPGLGQVLDVVGTMLGGIGICHKFVKAKNGH